MSKLLDENALLDKLHDKIEGYGTDAIFIEKDDTQHTRKITPPRIEKVLIPSGNAEEETLVCLVGAKDLPFDPKRLMRMKHNSVTYRVTDFEPLSSGDLVQAYKVFLAR